MPSPENSLFVSLLKESGWLTEISRKLENLYEDLGYGNYDLESDVSGTDDLNSDNDDNSDADADVNKSPN